ncbi:MAG: bestrophin family ion channel [Planctomycetota bacterium]
MYTKYKYSLREVLVWTRLEILWLFLLASVYTALYELAGWHWMEIPWTPLAMVGTAVAFLIGFQNNAAYGRAWEARKIWGSIVNESRTFAMMTHELITDEHATESISRDQLSQHRTRLIRRHIAWLTALRHAMRIKKSWEVFSEHRTSREWYEKVVLPERDTSVKEELRPLLGESEYEQVVDRTNHAVAILSLQFKDIRELKRQGLIWEFSFLEFHNVIRELVALQGKSERIKNFPYPRQFATIGHDLVRVFILLLPLGIVPQFSRLGVELAEANPMIDGYFVWLSVPLVAIVAWVFHTMLRIGTSGENPFEGSANDVPISTIARGIEIDLREMNGEPGSEIPDPLPTVHNVQM